MNDQQVYENLFNIPNHQGNANKNHSEASPHACQTATVKKTTHNTCRRCGGRGAASTTGGNAEWHSPWKATFGFLKQVETQDVKQLCPLIDKWIKKEIMHKRSELSN